MSSEIELVGESALAIYLITHLVTVKENLRSGEVTA